MDPKTGLVLVWDLDSTLVGSYSTNTNTQYPLNSRAIHILKESKKNPNVLANFLLTNNSDKDFIQRVMNQIKEEYDLENPFDLIYDAEHPKRYHPRNKQNKTFIPNYAVKTIYDVKNMLEDIGYSFNGYEYKDLLDYGKNYVYFFDDMNSHQLAQESNFTHITPPFKNNQDDKTDYSKIEIKLDIQEYPFTQTAGKRKTRKQKHKPTRKTRKQKYKIHNFLSNGKKKRKTY